MRKFLPFIHQIEENLGRNHQNYESKEVFNPDKLTVPLPVFTLRYAHYGMTSPDPSAGHLSNATSSCLGWVPRVFFSLGWDMPTSHPKIKIQTGHPRFMNLQVPSVSTIKA